MRPRSPGASTMRFIPNELTPSSHRSDWKRSPPPRSMAEYAISVSAMAPGYSGTVDARERRDANVVRHRPKLAGNLGQPDALDEAQAAPQRREEVVVVRGDDEARVETGQDPFPVAGRDAAPGDPGEEDVHRLVGQLVVVEVRAALVVEAHARDVDADPPHRTAPVRARCEPVEVVAGQLAVHRHLAPEQELGVPARNEAHDERPQLVRSMGDDLDRELAEAVQAHELRQRGRPVSLRRG